MTKKKRRKAGSKPKRVHSRSVKPKAQKSPRAKPRGLKRSKPVSKPRPRARKRPSVVRSAVRKRVVKPSAKSRPRPAPKPVRRIIRPGTPVDRPSPQPWVLAITDLRSRRGQLNYLRNTVKELRQTYRGFSAKEGFDTRHPENWSAARRRQVQQYGIRLHQLQSTRYLRVRPRTAAQREALQRHTGQLNPRQKTYVLHPTLDPTKAKVEYIFEPAQPLPFGKTKPAQWRVQLTQPSFGGVMYDRDFLFREILGYQPGALDRHGRLPGNPWADIIRATRALMKYMPDQVEVAPGQWRDAMFTLMSQAHGPVASPVYKKELLETLQEWGDSYAKSFVGILIGWRLQGDRQHAAMAPKSEYNERQRRRLLYAEVRRQDALAARRLPKRKKKVKPSRRKK